MSMDTIFVFTLNDVMGLIAAGVFLIIAVPLFIREWWRLRKEAKK